MCASMEVFLRTWAPVLVMHSRAPPDSVRCLWRQRHSVALAPFDIQRLFRVHSTVFRPGKNVLCYRLVFNFENKKEMHNEKEKRTLFTAIFKNAYIQDARSSTQSRQCLHTRRQLTFSRTSFTFENIMHHSSFGNDGSTFVMEVILILIVLCVVRYHSSLFHSILFDVMDKL